LAQPKELTPRARAKRDQIREGAQRVFLERGFAGTSTDAIASEAGVSKQTLYAYYASCYAASHTRRSSEPNPDG
jgi:TetR/AcrR family transcriptional repressor of mexJK operon